MSYLGSFKIFLIVLYRDMYQASGLNPRRPVNNKHIYRIERRRAREAQAREEAQARQEESGQQLEAEVVQIVEADLSKPFTFMVTSDGKVVEAQNEIPQHIFGNQYCQVIFILHISTETC